MTCLSCWFPCLPPQTCPGPISVAPAPRGSGRCPWLSSGDSQPHARSSAHTPFPSPGPGSNKRSLFYTYGLWFGLAPGAVLRAASYKVPSDSGHCPPTSPTDSPVTCSRLLGSVEANENKFADICYTKLPFRGIIFHIFPICLFFSPFVIFFLNLARTRGRFLFFSSVPHLDVGAVCFKFHEPPLQILPAGASKAQVWAGEVGFSLAPARAAETVWNSLCKTWSAPAPPAQAL